MRVKDARAARQRRHARVRTKVSGTAERPRLCIFRSLNHIYAQVVDDVQSHTVASASSTEPALKSKLNGKGKMSTATLVGTLLAERAREKGATTVVFDRAGYKYHGRVKALAEAAREGGLSF